MLSPLKGWWEGREHDVVILGGDGIIIIVVPPSKKEKTVGGRCLWRRWQRRGIVAHNLGEDCVQRSNEKIVCCLDASYCVFNKVGLR